VLFASLKSLLNQKKKPEEEHYREVSDMPTKALSYGSLFDQRSSDELFLRAILGDDKVSLQSSESNNDKISEIGAENIQLLQNEIDKIVKMKLNRRSEILGKVTKNDFISFSNEDTRNKKFHVKQKSDSTTILQQRRRLQKANDTFFQVTTTLPLTERNLPPK